MHKPRSGHNVHNYVTVVLPPPQSGLTPSGLVPHQEVAMSIIDRIRKFISSEKGDQAIQKASAYASAKSGGRYDRWIDKFIAALRKKLR